MTKGQTLGDDFYGRMPIQSMSDAQEYLRLYRGAMCPPVLSPPIVALDTVQYITQPKKLLITNIEAPSKALQADNDKNRFQEYALVGDIHAAAEAKPFSAQSATGTI